ncbi:coxN, partial [Symbiodinium necroappetens]
LPGADGQLGRADNRFVTFDNPLGIDPDDPAGQDDYMIVGGELVLPTDRPIHFALRSVDVLHNFYVPEIRAKMDMIPGSVTYFWATLTEPGTYQILCAELCGTGHSYMRGGLRIVGQDEYDEWLAGQMTRRQMANIPHDASASAPPAELGEMELYHPRSWWTKYVFSQDAKVIAVQYAVTAFGIGFVALVLSWLIRLQLGFPGTFTFITPEVYYQFITMHGMIMVVYLLTALFLGGFGNYLIPLMVGARDMVFPYANMLSYWIYLLAVLVLVVSFFVPGGPTGAGWTLYPPQAIMSNTPGQQGGIVLMLISLALFIIGFTM